MKFIFSTKSNATLNNWWLLIYRISISAFMLTHGWPKLQRLISGNGANFPDPLGIGNEFSLVLTVIGEVLAPVLVMLGLGTRWISLPVAFAMFVAAFMVHADDPFGKKEMALLYLVGYLTLVVMGGGKYSLDTLMGKRR
jgi:putative oxidoreductase